MRDDGADRDAARAAAALEIDPDRSNILCAVGSKGSGKSEALRTIFDVWPHDRVVVDVTGDARPDDPATIVLTAPFPAALPEPIEGARRVTVWCRLDPRSPTYVAQQDDALGLALYPRGRHVLVWVDEFAQMSTPTGAGPNLRLALQSSRHYRATLALAFQRPRNVPVLALQQADKVFIFRCPNRDDRDHIAKNIGYPTGDFEGHYAETIGRDDHAFLLWDNRQRVLIGCPALPLMSTHGPRA